MDAVRDVAQEKEFVALVGIDWAEQKHDICLLDVATGRREAAVLEHTPEAIDDWVTQLCCRFAGQPVAICLEQSRGALVYALLKYDFLVLFPLNPARLASYRDAVTNSGAKDDPTDAQLLLEYLACHRDHLRAWKPDDALTRQIGMLVEARRQAVDLRTQLSNQLRAQLKMYFPQAFELAGNTLCHRMACDFLLKWPTLEAVQKAAPQTIRKFYYGHNCRQDQLIEHRLQRIREARPLTTDQALLAAGPLAVTMLARLLRDLIASIDSYDKQIGKLMAHHPDALIFTSLPGAADALAPRLLAAFGSDRQRMDRAEEMQNFSGIAPVTKRSGKQTRIQRRWACPKFLLQTFHEFAGCSLKKSVWAKAYYDLQRNQGKGHHTAVRTLAFKWIRIIFRCWKNQTPYDESAYLEALRRRGSRLLEEAKCVA